MVGARIMATGARIRAGWWDMSTWLKSTKAGYGDFSEAQPFLVNVDIVDSTKAPRPDFSQGVGIMAG